MNTTIRKNSKILIIDDEPSNVRYLEMILDDAGYANVRSSTDARNALPLFLDFAPDLLLLDLHMPHLHGFEVMEQLQPQLGEHQFVPILVLTADTTSQSRIKALAVGAHDFLSKPFDTVEALQRIRNLLETRFHNDHLQESVLEQTRSLKLSQIETLSRLARAAEYRDDDTGQHTRRVGRISALLADGLNIPCQQVQLIEQAAPLHDVGKIGIPDSILLKPGKLSDEEFAVMKRHTVIGEEMLSGSQSPWLQMAATIAISHHERWDGRGYPLGIAGEAIPLIGRIVAVADVFDALCHERPYKEAWPLSYAVDEIVKNGGKQFDAQVVSAFLKLPHETLI